MCSIPELKPLELYIGTSEAQNAWYTRWTSCRICWFAE